MRRHRQTAHSPLPVVCTAHTASSVSQRAQCSPVGGWRFFHYAAPSESGCRSESPGNERSPPFFSPPPDVFFASLPPTEGNKWNRVFERSIRAVLESCLISESCSERGKFEPVRRSKAPHSFCDEPPQTTVSYFKTLHIML